MSLLLVLLRMIRLHRLLLLLFMITLLSQVTFTIDVVRTLSGDYPVKPILLPKGTKIACTAHFDNSANNADNPDPGKEVRYGDQSWEEMMIGFFNVAFDAKMEVKKLFPEKKSDKKSDSKPSAE